MTIKNTILLILKQNNGVAYNSLLNKFSASYSNINSAWAALSRSLKDLTIFGFIARKGNRFYLLEKGEQEIYSEIKNKLVIGLNSSLKQKHPEDEVDSIVSKLQVLIQRSKGDADLLKTSKSSLDFSITDLTDVSKKLDSKVKQLNYLSKVFKEQINSLKELEFNDVHALPLTKDSVSLLNQIFSKSGEKEITIECPNPIILDSIAENFDVKPKNNFFPIPKKFFNKLGKFIEKNKDSLAFQVITVYSSSLKAQFFREKIFLSGPYSEIRNWKSK